jgi:excinuclease UvrABC nuclease subunit
MTNLYRHYNTTGILLYVGISISAIKRLSEHAVQSRWFNQIAVIKIEKFETRKEAQLAEKQAIERENPLFNIKMNFQKVDVPFVKPVDVPFVKSNRLLTFREVNAMIGSICKTSHPALNLARKGLIESVRINERTIRFNEASVHKFVAGKIGVLA